MRGGDHGNGAVCHRCLHGKTVVLTAQRRMEAREAAIGAHGHVVEVEIGRARAGGDRCAFFL